MYRKYFFKNKGVLSRRFVASGLAAVFSAGMFGSYAGAMEQNYELFYMWGEESELANVVINDSIKDYGNDAEEVFKFFIYDPYLISKLRVFATNFLVNEDENNEDENNEELLENEATRLYAYLLLYKFYKIEDKTVINDFLIKCDLGVLAAYFNSILRFLKGNDAANLLKKIKVGWGNELLRKVKKEKQEQDNLKNINTNLNNEGNNGNEKEVSEEFGEENEQNDSKNDDKEVSEELVEENEQNDFEKVSLQDKSINENELDKNIKNKKIFVFVVIILLAIIVTTITLALKGKSNTGVPNNNKDDEKVNPSIEPEKDKDDEKMYPSTDPESDDEKVKPPIDPSEPSTDPESDEQNSQQNNQEERPSVVLSNILKATGATVTAGTLAGGTYLFNKVLKSGKPSEVKNQKNIDGKYTYLDSVGNKVTKTEEGRKDNYDADDENANNSGKKQLLEDKDAEEKEEEQEEILERSTLSDDTEATSDGDKNKD